MQVWGMFFWIVVKIAMNYLENNLSGVTIITRVYISFMRTLEDI